MRKNKRVYNKRWTHREETIIIENYATKTARELEELLPGRDKNSIDCKIKRLKLDGKINGYKDEETVRRAYDTRQRF